MSESSIPDSGVASPSTLPGRCDRSRADASVIVSRPASASRCSTTAAAPSFGEHSIQRCSGSQTTRDASTSSRVTGLAEHRVGVVHAVAAVLHHDVGEMLLREPGFAQQALRPQGEVGRRGREAGLLAPGFEERRADDALGHLLHPEHEHAVVLAGADRAGRELQRGAAARAAGLDVDDRHAGARERAEHLVAGRDAAVGGAAERGLETRVARLRRARRAPRARPCRCS